MARKYEDVKGYWVYSIKVPSINKFYIGVSKQPCNRRWRKCNYKGLALEPYLNEWQDMIKTVLMDGLSKEQAYQYEDNIIRALQMNNICLNEQRSGLIANDINAYHKELLKNNPEYYENQKQLCKQWYENNKEDVEFRERKKQQCKQWRENNREQYNEYHKQWQKQYYERNKEKIKEYQKQYYLKKKLEKQQQTSLL